MAILYPTVIFIKLQRFSQNNFFFLVYDRNNFGFKDDEFVAEEIQDMVIAPAITAENCAQRIGFIFQKLPIILTKI